MIKYVRNALLFKQNTKQIINKNIQKLDNNF